ncbi:MAG: hypothetical protein AB7R90_06360 [Reyranellaceae bacterium]
MSDFPLSRYSKNDIERAGQTIAADIKFSGPIPPNIHDAFLIANNWRDAHAYPMRSIHLSIGHHMRTNQLKGVTAARLKRMQAIRRKLQRIKLGLDQIQDLGGCRVILPSIAEVRSLIGILKEKLPSEVHKEDDYIAKPKKDGYRSHHVIFSFRRPQPTRYDGKRIELQVRTRLQHSWATTVEAVGLFRGEELKTQKGDKDWLRLFTLMSAEFADAENCPTVPGTPEPKARKEEIKRLAASLDAVGILDSISNGFQGPDLSLTPDYKPSHYLIRYDRVKRTATVDPYQKARQATASYDQAEAGLRADQDKGVVVLIEVDKIENLKTAYPNYFGDVELFKKQLREIALGGSAVEYTRPPKQSGRKLEPEEWASPSWLLRGSRFPRPSAKFESEKKKKKKKSKP